MGKTVQVTRVTLEYAFDGKLFTMDFPEPEKINSIVFSKIDLDRIRAQQAADTKEVVVARALAPGRPFPEMAEELQVFAVSRETDTTTAANGTEGRSLWWHTNSCSWFHPEEDES